MKIYALKSDVPPINENEYYVESLIDLDVYNTDNLYLGKVTDVIEIPSGYIIEIIDEKNKRFLMPFVDEYVKAIDDEKIKACIANRRIFPCYFGSALKNQGVDTLLHGLEKWMRAKEYNPEFGAKIYKITRDDNGNRLTHLKVTGGTLSVKDCIFKDEFMRTSVTCATYGGEHYENVAFRVTRRGELQTEIPMPDYIKKQILEAYELYEAQNMDDFKEE